MVIHNGRLRKKSQVTLYKHIQLVGGFNPFQKY